MQQQFERMNLVFGEIRDRMDRQDEVIATLQKGQQRRALEEHSGNDEFEADYGMFYGEDLEGDDNAINFNKG